MKAVGATALILAIAALSFVRTLPDVVGRDAPATEFSAERAADHIRRIAQKPRPSGSPYNAEVRAYLVVTLKELGLETEVQTGQGLYHVHNIVASLPGTASTGTVLFCAHYDSVPQGPGASDDAAGVAAILETLRALRAGPPLRNTLMILFTDGEERGLIGATLFLRHHPRRREPRVALNFDSRGSAGPSLMYETSWESAWLVREFIDAAPHPTCSSLMAGFARHMPNLSDFTSFRAARFEGLNFAYIEGYGTYHDASDTIENLDLRSVQHHGTHMMAMARRLGGIDLGPRERAEIVYFNPFGTRHVVVYSKHWVWPQTALALLLLAIVVRRARRRGELAGKAEAAGFGVALLACLVAAAVAAALAHFALWLHDGYRPKYSRTAADPLFFVALTLGAVATATVVLDRFSRRLGENTITIGGLLLGGAVLLSANLTLWGGSFLFFWPLFVAVLARMKPLSPTLFFVLMLPVVFLVAPRIHLFFLATALGRAPLVVLLLGLMVGLMWPLVCLRARAVAATAGAVGLAAYVTALIVA